MKKILAITIGIIMVVLVSAQTPNDDKSEIKIKFQATSWEKALALSAKENKPIFLDISTSWCGYCKRMKSKVYTDAEVAAYYNANFINVIVDGEVGEGIKLNKKYGVTAYPALIFINPDGSLNHQTKGYHKPDKFIKLGKSVIK